MAIVNLKRQVFNPFASSSRVAGSAQLSAEYDCTFFHQIAMLVDLTALTGTPSTTSLAVKIQYSPDTAGTRWYDLSNGAITTLTGVGTNKVDSVTLNTARRVRVSYTLAFTGGTAPHATFTVDISMVSVSGGSGSSGGGGGGGAITVGDGDDTNAGSTGDGAIITDTTGTMSGKLRGIVKILASVWDAVNSWLKVSEQNMPGAEKNGGTNPHLVTRNPYTLVNLTASGIVLAVPGFIRGFYVNSTTAGTIKLYDNASAASGTVAFNTITPLVGPHSFPGDGRLAAGCYATIGGTIDVTFFVDAL